MHSHSIASTIERRQNTLVALAFTEHIRVLFERTPLQLGLFPQVRCQEAVCVGDGLECSLECVF